MGWSVGSRAALREYHRMPKKSVLRAGCRRHTAGSREGIVCHMGRTHTQAHIQIHIPTHAGQPPAFLC